VVEDVLAVRGTAEDAGTPAQVPEVVTALADYDASQRRWSR
jgi:hypothetical protein